MKNLAPISVVICALLTGCSSGLFDDTTYTPTPEMEKRLREIQNVDLKDVSVAPGDEPANVPPENTTDWPDEFPLTIEQSRAHALANNLDLDVALLDPSIARQSISEAEAAFEAAFFANARFNSTDTPVDTQLTGSQTENLSVTPGLRVPLRTGGSITLQTPFNRRQTDNQFATLNPSYVNNATLSISQPLLRNAGRRVNEYPIRIAQLNTAMSESQTKLAVINVLAQVERAYWLLYATRRELDVRKQELELAEELLARARRLVDAGEAAEVEVIRAESGVAQRKDAIILAENNVRNTERDLKRILNIPNIPLNSTTVVVPETEPNPLNYRLDPGRITATALESRMEMLQLELQLLQDASTIDLRRNQLLPLLTVDYTYGINGLGATHHGALDVLADKEFENHTIGLHLDMPLGNEAAESRLRTAMLSRMRRIGTRNQREAQITQEVHDAIDQLTANWQRILAAQQSTILAARVLEAEQRQFELGLRTSTDVLDAQTRLADAQSSEIRAVTNYQIAQVNIASAAGMLLGSSQIRWEPRNPKFPGE
jgi:outer membrane protein TolC